MVDIKLDDCINDNAQQIVTAEMILLGKFYVTSRYVQLDT